MNEYIIVIVVLLLSEVAYLIIANKIGIIDKPHHQSSHSGVVIRGGGIIFYLSYLIWFLFCGMDYPMIFIGLSIMAATSFADDIKSFSPHTRLVLQFAAIIVMLYETHVFNLSLHAILILSVVCVGMVNICNFMDGINGMTGGYSIVVLLSLLYVNNYCQSFVDNKLIIYILLADLLFCLFNFRKRAICFAGDVGALSIGFILLFLVLKLIMVSHHMYWIIFLGVYAADGALTVIHRVLLGENLLKPHKKHVYQIMANELKIPHLRTSGIYMSLQAVICSVFIIYSNYLTFFVLVVLLSIVYLLFIKKYYRLHEKKDRI